MKLVDFDKKKTCKKADKKRNWMTDNEVLIKVQNTTGSLQEI